MIQLGGFSHNFLGPVGLTLDASPNSIGEKFSSWGIALANNEIKGIMRVIRSVESRGILLKEITKKIRCQEGGLLNFVKSLMTTALSLMKNVLTILDESILVPLGLTAAASATDVAIQNKIFKSGTYSFKWRNKWYHENN